MRPRILITLQWTAIIISLVGIHQLEVTVCDEKIENLQDWYLPCILSWKIFESLDLYNKETEWLMVFPVSVIYKKPLDWWFVNLNMLAVDPFPGQSQREFFFFLNQVRYYHFKQIHVFSYLHIILWLILKYRIRSSKVTLPKNVWNVWN